MLPEAFAENAGLALLYALGVVAASMAVAFLANLIVGLALNMLVKRHERPFRSITILEIGALRAPIVLVIVLYGIRLALTSLSQASTPSLGFISNLVQLGHNAWVVAVAAIICYAISRLIIALMRWYSASVPQDTRTALNTVILPILIRITSVFVFTLGTLVALDLMGIPITPLLAGIGIGGLAIALALSPTISSFIAGTYVVAEGHISEGDYVEIDSERSGFVTGIGWRSTVLRSRFNNMIVVPNSLITENILINYTTPTPSVTGTVECGVSYESDLKRVEQVSLQVAGEVIEESEDANKNFQPVIRFYEFADSNINFLIRFQGIDRVAMNAMKHEIIMRLHAHFREEGIEINYPVRKLMTASPEDYPRAAGIDRVDALAAKDAPAPDEIDADKPHGDHVDDLC